MTDNKDMDMGNEIDAIFREADFASEDRGFRGRLRAMLMRHMEKAELAPSEDWEAELGEEELAQAAGGRSSFPTLPYCHVQL